MNAFKGGERKQLRALAALLKASIRQSEECLGHACTATDDTIADAPNEHPPPPSEHRVSEVRHE